MVTLNVLFGFFTPRSGYSWSHGCHTSLGGCPPNSLPVVYQFFSPIGHIPPGKQSNLLQNQDVMVFVLKTCF